MMKSIMSFFRKLKYKERYSSETFVEYLRNKGIEIGEGVRFFDPKSTVVDTQNPHMLKIGDNVRITRGTTILTRDYSWSVIAGKYHEVLGGIGKVKIGNNVFIGVHSIILKNSIIGDNVIIGAGSIVSGVIESDSVYAGAPCKKIMTLDDFYKKRKSLQMQEYESIVKELEQKGASKEKIQKATLEYFSVAVDQGEKLAPEILELIKRTGYYNEIISKWENEGLYDCES